MVSAPPLRPRLRRRLLGGVAALGVLVVVLGVVHLRGGSSSTASAGAAHAAGSPVPSWLPALRAPVPVPTPGPLDLGWLATHPSPDLGIHAAGALLVDVDAHEVMWVRDPHVARPPASLTKLLTALVAVDLAGSLDRQVTVPVEATQVGADSTVMGLSAGEAVSVRDLMYGLFLVSGNDAAEALARTLTDRDHFVALMNERAAALGMTDSHFTNPTGLDEAGLRASPYDLAVAALQVEVDHPDLFAIAGTKDEELPATDTHEGFSLHTLIRLLVAYPGATGLKSGYTDDAGYCLVGTATRGDRHLAVVLLASDLALTADATRLLDYGFEQGRPGGYDAGAVPQL